MFFKVRMNYLYHIYDQIFLKDDFFAAVAQMANLMAEWLILAGAEINEVQQRVENHLHDMILKTFDPKKADAIFAEEGETPSW